MGNEQQEPHYVDRSGGAPFRVDGPGCTPATLSPAAAAGRAAAERVLRASGAIDDQEAEVSVPCLGDDCTGCSNPQCWTARADGGDV